MWLAGYSIFWITFRPPNNFSSVFPNQRSCFVPGASTREQSDSATVLYPPSQNVWNHGSRVNEYRGYTVCMSFSHKSLLLRLGEKRPTSNRSSIGWQSPTVNRIIYHFYHPVNGRSLKSSFIEGAIGLIGYGPIEHSDVNIIIDSQPVRNSRLTPWRVYCLLMPAK